MSPYKFSFALIGVAFVVAMALCAVILHSALYGPALGCAAVIVIWLWLSWRLAVAADAEVLQIREHSQRRRNNSEQA